MRIWIAPLSRGFWIEVESTDTIWTAKRKIMDREGYEPEKIKLFYHGLILPDNYTFQDIGIENESRVQLVRCHEKLYKIHINFVSGHQMTLSIPSTVSTNYIKCIVWRLENIPGNQQCLFYENQKLLDKKLSEYSIKDGSIIKLCAVPY